MSKLIPLDEVQIGMVVSESVINSFGQTLIQAGSEITEKHIKILSMWSINHIHISGKVIVQNELSGNESSVEDESVIDEETEAFILAKQRLDSRIVWSPKNELEEDLYEIGMIRAYNLITKKET